ncbi:MAG: flagellar hook-basal body complex protein [Phycisphaerae bacterium]|nr:flagellar hook-basal body complex protein [Phycisphaerae bacterium]
MGLTSSLFAGLTGMKTNEFRMDVIGNNIANVNTTAFKSSRATFASQFYDTLSFGSAPSGATGGSNPMQIGTGVQVGAINVDFSEGAPETTGIKTDMAVQGQGLFVMERADGAQVYTRDGNFQFNSENYLMSASGNFLMGYGIDNDFNVVKGSMSRLRIPLGEITTAKSTTTASFAGNLNAGGDAVMAVDAGVLVPRADVRSVLSSQEIYDGAAAATDASLLININDDAGSLFSEGNLISLDEANKGNKTMDSVEFEVSATSTLADLMTWLEGALGISTDSSLPDYTAAANPSPNPGISISDVAGSTYLEIVGNMGNNNKLEPGNKYLSITQGTAAAAVTRSAPINLITDVEMVNIESARTTFRGYDTLGNPIDLDVTFVLESPNESGGVNWRFFIESPDDSDDSRVLGTGTIKFDGKGNYLEASDTSVVVDRAFTGAITPQSIGLDFSGLKSYEMTSSAVSLLSQDGFKSGTLQDYSIGSDGTITGSFTNGLTRSLGQVIVATFRNYEGLIAQGNNVWMNGPNSGDPLIKQPQELGAGSISSSSLELSNVDLSREFINLIVSSTGFSASSRVIQTSDQLLDELIAMTR